MQKALYASALAAAALGFTFATATARADQEFDVTVAGGSATITAKSGWHVNKDYPWSVRKDKDVLADKTKFTFDGETIAKVAIPAGATTLKGGVCSGDKCKSFEFKLPGS